MALSFDLDPPLTGELRAAIVALWVDVTNAGGAVGFVAPVTADDVVATADAAFGAVVAGREALRAGGDAGGRVAFVALVTADAVVATADAALGGVVAGRDPLLVGVDAGRPVALLFVAD